MSPAIVVVVVVDIVSRNTACREMHQQLFEGVTVNGARWTDSSEWGLSG